MFKVKLESHPIDKPERINVIFFSESVVVMHAEVKFTSAA